MSNSVQAATTSADEEHTLAGKYLTFLLGDEEYGIEILRVQEIIGLLEITPVPRIPESIRGVINLRGRIIPVVELRILFNMNRIADTELTCIIIVDVPHEGRKIQIGVLVDTVCEVLDIAAEHIEASPAFGTTIENDFILGMAKINGAVKILLDTDNVMRIDRMIESLAPNMLAGQDDAKQPTPDA